MQSKVNIFHSLQHASDSEEDNDPQTQKAKKIAEKKEKRAVKEENTTKVGNARQVPQGDKQVREGHDKAKNPYKAKAVTEEPHPQDRHSGHKNQAYGEKPKKQGAGKGNWGNYREDRKGDDEVKEVAEGEEGAAQEKVEEAPVGITLAEYYQQRSQAQNQPQVNEAKAKITSEQLTKELGTATALKTKNQQQIDDKKVGKKKDRLDVNHKAAINSENANLLNFRTGFIEKEYKQRGPEDLNAPKTRGPRTGGQKEDNKQEEGAQQATEGQTAEAQPTEAVAQEGATAEVQAQGEAKGQDQNKRRNEGHRGGRGGYRGGERHQGDRAQGDRPQGDRPQGDRPRKPQGQGQLNFDDSAFPKLG